MIKKIIILLLLPIVSFGQFKLKENYPSLITAFSAGMFEGGAETLKFHFYKVKNKYPNVNENYWNPDSSWKNKYKNNDYTQGPKFLGSTTFLVWTTDGYHMLRTSRNFMVGTTILLHKGSGPKKKWYYYATDLAAHGLAYQIGFHTTYSLIFK